MVLPEFWRGSVTGRQGTQVKVRLKQGQDGHIQGRLILTDYIFGPALSSLDGSLQGSHAELTLGEAWTIAPVSASSGTASIDFDAANRTASGNWQTDLGVGHFTVRAIGIWHICWWWWNVKFFVFLLLPNIYGILLLLLFFLSARGNVTLSGPLLILALIPAPFLFQRYIARIVRIFGIQALGPVQLGSQQLPTFTGPLFSSLDSYFALRTKAILIWLAEKPPHTVTTASLETVNRAPVAAELEALISLGCIRKEGETFDITDLGRRYVAHCVEGELQPTPRHE
jgi:hypothetical protein